MPIKLNNPKDIGLLIRAARKASDIDRPMRQDDTAGAVGISEVTLGRIEKGAPGVRLGNVCRALEGLGVELQAVVPPQVAEKFEALQKRKCKKPKP